MIFINRISLSSNFISLFRNKHILIPILILNPTRSGGGGGGVKIPPPLSSFALTHLILELHYCALGSFPKK